MYIKLRWPFQIHDDNPHLQLNHQMIEKLQTILTGNENIDEDLSTESYDIFFISSTKNNRL